MRYKFDLHVKYTIEVDIPSPFQLLSQLQKRCNQDFAYILRDYIPNLEISGSSSASSPLGTPIRNDEDLRNYLRSVPTSSSIGFEIRIPQQYEATVMESYASTIAAQSKQIQHLQSQVSELRTQGSGLQSGLALIQQIASTHDGEILDAICKSGQGISPCITAMVASPHEQSINHQGLRALTHYGVDNPQRMEEIYYTGGFQTVVKAMLAFPDDIAIQQLAHHIIASAARTPEFCAELQRHGAIVPIIRNLKRFSNDPLLLQYGCWALGELASTPEYRETIVQADGILPLINALRNFPQDPQVNHYVLAALQCLACNPVYAPEISNNFDGVRVITSALNTHQGDAQVSSKGIATLAELASHENCRAKVCSGSVIPITLTTMKTYMGDVRVQESGLRCLAILAAGDSSSQALIQQSQGIQPIVYAINSAVDSRKPDGQTCSLIAQGLNLLASLATNADCWSQILQCRGIDCVSNAVKMYSDASIAEHGLRLLASLAASPNVVADMFKGGCLEVIISCMRKHPQEMIVQLHGCYAIGMLASADESKLLIARGGGIQAVLNAMFLYPRESHVHEHGCAALACLADLDQNKVIISETVCGEGERRHDGAQLIMNSARNMCGISSAVKQALKLVALVGVNDNVKEALLRLGMLECILSALQEHCKDSSLLCYGFKAFVTLSTPQPPDVSMGLCYDIVDCVVSGMQYFPKDARIHQSACEVFSILGRFEALEEQLIQKGVVRSICTALRDFQADVGVQRRACRAFANMAEYMTSRARIRMDLGIELVVSSMKCHPANADVGEQACAAIANLALDEDNRREVARCGGVEAVLSGLRTHQKHPGVQGYGLGALGNLAVEEENCNAVLRAGAMDLVMHAMSTWPDDARVQHFACLACSNFAHEEGNKTQIGRMGANRLIIAAMRSHADHAGVQEQACAALANLGMIQQNMSEIAQMDGIEFVVASLKRHSFHPGMQENACFALSKFLAMPNENYRQRMKKAGAEEALNMIKDGCTSFDVRICVNVLLRRLTGDDIQAGSQQQRYQGQAPSWGGQGQQQQQQPGFGQQPSFGNSYGQQQAGFGQNNRFGYGRH